ncbi:MAG: CsgG/HfaB family protein [Elusimicrobiales bacterium]|nr:CsgG/HfaB family protein [Elusimicrobiales bacterium]
MKKFLLPLLAAALGAAPAQGGLFPEGAFSDEARGLTGAQFLKAPPHARFGALAGAGLALSGGECYFLNPAGAAGQPAGLAVTWEALLAGSSRTGLVYSRPTSKGVFSGGLVYNNSSPGLEKLDGAGVGAGADLTAYDLAAGAGWARRLGWADLGVGLKYVKSRLAEASGATAALDAGLVFREPAPSRTELALSLRNFGPPLKLGSESAPLPFELGGGLKWKYTPDFNILAEGRLPADHAPYLVFGAEWFMPFSAGAGLFLRSGMNFRNYDDLGAMGAFACGFGLKLGGLSVDYAFTPYGDLGAAHRMTAGLAFGPVPAAAAAPPLPPSAALAVAAFTAGQGVTETEAAVIRNMVEDALVKTGKFRVVERSKLDFILAEKKLAYAGLSEERTAAELGRVSGAALAVSGSVTKYPDGYLILAHLVDAASAATLRTETAAATEDYLFRDAARRLAAALSK